MASKPTGSNYDDGVRHDSPGSGALGDSSGKRELYYRRIDGFLANINRIISIIFFYWRTEFIADKSGSHDSFKIEGLGASAEV